MSVQLTAFAVRAQGITRLVLAILAMLFTSLPATIGQRKSTMEHINCMLMGWQSPRQLSAEVTYTYLTFPAQARHGLCNSPMKTPETTAGISLSKSALCKFPLKKALESYP